MWLGERMLLRAQRIRVNWIGEPGKLQMGLIMECPMAKVVSGTLCSYLPK